MKTHDITIDLDMGRIGGVPIRSAEPDISVTYTAEAERSARVMSNMDAETKAVHARLDEWARAVKRLGDNLGYPKESIYTKANLIRTEGRHEEQISDRVANVDAAVTNLRDVDRRVIHRYYLHWQPTNIWKGLEGVRNEGQWKVILKRARWRVDGYLGAIEKPNNGGASRG